MTKGLGLLVLTAALIVGLPAFAGNDEEETHKGLLSFSFDPGEFFQAGPAGAEEKPASGDGEAGEEKVKDARVFVKFALFGLFRFHSREGDPDTFNMPGAYIRGEGEWKNYKVSFMTNAAVTNTLTWAYIDMAPWIEHKDKLKLRLGVFAVPFGLQIQTFPFDLTSVEYSMIVQDVTDVIGIYDTGAMVHGRFKVQDGGINYALAILNGEFATTADTNDAKNLAGRIGFEFTPFFEVGASFYKGKFTDNIWNFDTYSERFGVDLKWTPGEFRVRGEYIGASEDPESHYSGSPPVFDRGVMERAEGWWLDVGMFLWVNEKISKKYDKRGFEIYGHFQGFAPPRNDAMEAATGHAYRTQFVYGIGINVHLSKDVKLQALWQHLDLGAYNLGKYSGYNPKKRDDVIFVQLAVAVF